MKRFLDSSILVAALLEDEPHHEACLALLDRPRSSAWTHALAETFSTLTGGRIGNRVRTVQATELLEALRPHLIWVALDAADTIAEIAEASVRGVRGGALYDALHLRAARKTGAEVLYTLNARHFLSIARIGDPRIETP